jgi:hypothetical protein
MVSSKCEGHVMGQAVHHYLIFETAGGFCGIAWKNVGYHALSVADKKRGSGPNELCCAGHPAPNAARQHRGWWRPSPL